MTSLIDFSQFSFINVGNVRENHANTWRAKIVSSYKCSHTQELFLMTKACLPESISEERGGIFTKRGDSHEFNAVVVVDLETNQTKWIAVRTAVGIRPAKTRLRISRSAQVGEALIDCEKLLPNESNIKRYSFDETNSLMINFSQTPLNIRCRMTNGDELAFPVEYCNYTMMDDNSYLQPICYPSIYVSHDYIYHGAFAVHLRNQDQNNHAEFLAARVFNPLGKIRGAEEAYKASRSKLWPFISSSLFRLFSALMPCEHYNDLMYNGYVECDFYKVN